MQRQRKKGKKEPPTNIFVPTPGGTNTIIQSSFCFGNRPAFVVYFEGGCRQKKVDVQNFARNAVGGDKFLSVSSVQFPKEEE